MEGQKDWWLNFDERQLKEIAFSRVYAQQFNHGTDGHNAKLIISKLADLLDKADPKSANARGLADG
jgi:hypothetical protein